MKSYKILQKLSPKHAAGGVAQSSYPIYRHAAGPGFNPRARRARCAPFFSPPSLPPSAFESFFRTFPTKPTKVLGLLYTTGWVYYKEQICLWVCLPYHAFLTNAKYGAKIRHEGKRQQSQGYVKRPTSKVKYHPEVNLPKHCPMATKCGRKNT